MKSIACLAILLLTTAAFAEPPTDPAEKAIALLSAGKQSEAEQVVFAAAKKQRTTKNLFFAAVLVRSRFEIQEADLAFDHIIDDDPDSTEGKAAKLVVAIDKGDDTAKNFSALNDLSKANDKDPLLLWLVCVECRQLHKNKLGIERYNQLLKTFDPGPSLVHQTLGNLYIETHQPAEALKHYDKSIELEPAAWNYNCRGNALADLKRYDDAAAAYQKATDLDPDYVFAWQNWARLCGITGDTAGRDEKLAKAKALQGRD